MIGTFMVEVGQRIEVDTHSQKEILPVLVVEKLAHGGA